MKSSDRKEKEGKGGGKEFFYTSFAPLSLHHSFPLIQPLTFFLPSSHPPSLLFFSSCCVCVCVHACVVCLRYCVEELQRCNEPLAIAVLVVHNKDKPKKGVLPKGVTCVSITLYS